MVGSQAQGFCFATTLSVQTPCQYIQANPILIWKIANEKVNLKVIKTDTACHSTYSLWKDTWLFLKIENNNFGMAYLKVTFLSTVIVKARRWWVLILVHPSDCIVDSLPLEYFLASTQNSFMTYFKILRVSTFREICGAPKHKLIA